MANQFQIEVTGPIVWIINNRPKALNAISGEAWDEFNDIVDKIDDDESIRVAIIIGEGRAFCGGADVHIMAEHVEMYKKNEVSNSLLRKWQNRLQHSTRKIRGAKIPYIAAIHGYAVGAGFELCCACDLIVAEEDTLMGFPETRVGVTVTNGGTFFASRIFGVAKTREMAYTGDFIDADEAYRLGGICRIAPKGQLREEAENLAQRIARRAPIPTTLHKRLFDRGMESSLEGALVYETECLITTAKSSDHAEGSTAFVEKREPSFTGY